MSDNRQEQELNEELHEMLYGIYEDCRGVLNDTQKACMCYMFGIDAFRKEVAERDAAVARFMKPFDKIMQRFTQQT